MSKWIYKFVLICSALLSVYYLLQANMKAPDNQYKEQYGDDYQLDFYDDYEQFKQDYPELVKEVDYYYNFLTTIKESYEVSSENNSVRPSIRVINDKVESASFDTHIYDSNEDIGVNYNLYLIENGKWEANILAEGYDIRKEDIWGVLHWHFAYVEKIVGVDLYDFCLEAVASTHVNYYKVKTIESEIDGYNVGFNYNGQGDYKIFLNKVLPRRQSN